MSLSDGINFGFTPEIAENGYVFKTYDVSVDEWQRKIAKNTDELKPIMFDWIETIWKQLAEHSQKPGSRLNPNTYKAK